MLEVGEYVLLLPYCLRFNPYLWTVHVQRTMYTDAQLI